jgi:methoxymalonate biosynthesis acyl carrier protein
VIGDIEGTIFAFIKARFPDIDLAIDDDIFAVGFVNSLFALELVMFIEKTFGIVVANEELRLENFCTVGAMARLVHSAVALVAQNSESR